jgi:hypothetical protein
VSSIAPLATPPTFTDDRRRHGPSWTLALTSLGSFMVVLDALVVATALSTLRRELGMPTRSIRHDPGPPQGRIASKQAA